MILTHFMSRPLSMPPENITKPLVLRFQGVWKENSGMKWVKKHLQGNLQFMLTLAKTWDEKQSSIPR